MPPMASQRCLPQSSPKGRAPLCRVCNRINFHNALTERIQKPITLGNWGGIRRSSWSCSFCDLVVASLYKAEHASKVLSGLFLDTQIFLTNEKSWTSCVAHVQYYGPDSSDYSNKSDMQAAAQEQAKTMDEPYRLVVTFDDCDDDAYNGHIQYLADHESEDEQQFFGRSVDTRRANLGLAHSWFRKCSKFHGPSCAEPGKASSRLRQIRVIDIERRLVITAPRNCRYVALTYVWGGPQKFEARKAKIRITSRGTECLPLPNRLPRTIEDYCYVTRELGFKYLWVDSLCIVQDDNNDLHHQILHMDAIYSSAVLTIAAASSTSADHGLPSISRPRDHRQYVQKAKGVRFSIPFPPLSMLEQDGLLIWNTRGWTFQEKIMSRRLLVFTDFQMYYRCSNVVWCEDLTLESVRMSGAKGRIDQPLRWAADRSRSSVTDPFLRRKLNNLASISSLIGIRHVDPLDKPLMILLNYISVVGEFTKRSLSNPRDGVNAVMGVLNTLQEAGPFHCGLPGRYLDIALLWHVSIGSEISLKQTAAGIFPTWSWAAWNLPQGCSWNSSDVIRRSVNGSRGSCTKFLLFESHIQDTWSSEGRKACRPPMPYLELQTKLDLRQIGYMLYMKTTTGSFRIGARCHTSATSVPARKTASADEQYSLSVLLNAYGHTVGEIWIARAWRKKYSERYMDFIALSAGIGLADAEIASLYVPTEYRSENSFIPQSRDEWRIVNVMMVGWRGQVARRLAIGKVIKGAWQSKKKKWIMLA